DGMVELRTIKPGAYPVPDSGGWWRPPHVHFSVWGRAWLSRLVTQMFFPGEPLNERDAILNAVREPQARAVHRAPRAGRPGAGERARLRVPARRARPERFAGAAMKRLVPTAEMTLGPFFPREFA